VYGEGEGGARTWGEVGAAAVDRLDGVRPCWRAAGHVAGNAGQAVDDGAAHGRTQGRTAIEQGEGNGAPVDGAAWAGDGGAGRYGLVGGAEVYRDACRGRGRRGPGHRETACGVDAAGGEVRAAVADSLDGVAARLGRCGQRVAGAGGAVDDVDGDGGADDGGA